MVAALAAAGGLLAGTGHGAGAQAWAGLPPLAGFGARATSSAVRAARDAQRRYEIARRRLLDRYAGGAAPTRCDVTIGRLCYWDNNGDLRPPLESPAERRARWALVADLARAAAADTTSDWIAGQRVRYLVEAARAEDDSASEARPVQAHSTASAGPGSAIGSSPTWDAADSAAAACRGTPWWCAALAGLAAHAAGRYAAAAAAFDRARALLPDAAARCAWDDVSPWLPPRAVGAYRRLPCGSAERERYEARAWRLAQPFWMLGGADGAGAVDLHANDLRSELAARRTLVRLHSGGENPQALPWGDDLAASDVRYGVPVAWSRRDPVGLNAEPSVVGHEPTPSYDFWPDARALAPDALLAPAPHLPDAGAWALRREGAQSRYAPAYAAAGVYALPHQLARFRRGDTLVVVGAYDARERGDSVPPGTGTGPVRAGLVLEDLRGAAGGGPAAPPGAVVRAGAPREGALVVRVPGGAVTGGGARWLVGLEVFDSAAVRFTEGRTRRGRAGRVREGLAPPEPGARLSDLLVVRPGFAAAGPPALAAAAESAFGTPEARVGAPMGLYWEQYGPAGGAAADTVVITATRLAPTVRERIGALVGRPTVLRAVRARYAQPRDAGGVGRTATLVWPDVPLGWYRIEVSLPGGAGAAPAASAVEVRVVR